MRQSEFVALVDYETGKAYVQHNEHGFLIYGVDSLAAAEAIAVLANLGHLFRDPYGNLYVDEYSTDERVSTLDEHMEEMEEVASDDAPTVEESTDEYGPLESVGE
jgi:hypothetical protein